MIATIKDMNEFKLKVNLEIAKINSNELARIHIVNRYKTMEVMSDETFIIKDNNIFIRVLENMYVVVHVLTENDFIHKQQIIDKYGK